MRACNNYHKYNTDNIYAKYEISLRTNEALRKKIKRLERNIDELSDELSSDYVREQNTNFRLAELRQQVNELKVENTRVRNYIKFYNMSLYEAIYDRGD